MLEREKSAKAAGEGLRLRGEDVAKRRNLGVLLCDCHFAAVEKKSNRERSSSRKCLPKAARLFFGGDAEIWWGVKVPSDKIFTAPAFTAVDASRIRLDIM